MITSGLIFFISGFIFKLALVPAHSWSVDIYCGSPTNVVLFIIGFVKLSVIITAFRIFSSYKTGILSLSMYIFVILTLIIPNISALFTKNIKRILVYSSISHSGFIALSFMGPQNWQTYFYAIIYSISAVGVFSFIMFLEKNYSDIEYQNIKGLYYKKPALSIALSIFLFSFAGVPPFSGFFAKFYAFYNALEGGYKELIIIAVISSAISLYYYLKILIPIFFEKPDNDRKIISYINNSSIIYITATITLFFGILSEPIIELLKK